MPDTELVFSPSFSNENGSYKLIELTPELTQWFENAIKNEQEVRLNIKGQADEDAVLCTADKTYGMRSVNLSNSVLVVRPVPDEHSLEFSNDTVVICDQLNEIIELAPVVPKLHKLISLVRGRVYDESQEDEDEGDIAEDSVKRFTYDDAKEQIQASEAELDKGLKDRRILVINNELRPIATPFLIRLIELMLNLLVSLSMKYTSVSVDDLSSALADEHEVPRSVSVQVMSWFGEIKEGRWKMDVEAIVKEVGLGILRNHRHEPIAHDDLVSQWKAAVGDTFESTVSMSLLEGNYLGVDTIESTSALYKYFPALDLPVEPAARFSDLFLTRPKWKGEDIAPFLADIAVNSKERDKLLLKYCRTVNDGQGIRYTARAQYSG